ncbi:MAG TPA: hypothetical protein VE575_14795, partial [Acidimicrobiales bacterium]|nr:hypothetical protein [Acidimicrobiales bacterium]
SAVGVRVPAAQIGPFLDGLSPGGDLRPAYPSDPVEMWLDEEHLVPLEVVVRAGEDPHRARWAATQGVTERPGDIVVAFTVTSVAINDAAPAGALGAPDEPAPDEHIDAGFRRAGAGDGEDGGGAADLVAPAPRELPAGFEPYRAGITTGTGGPTIAVRSWTDGRAWLTVRATTEWSGGRLFGGLGTSVRRVDLGDAGVGYASEAGDMVALHADGLDVVVSGSVLPDDLQAAAASLGVTGRPVPATWDEAATATLDQAALGTDRLLVAADLDGFGSPAVRTGGDTTTQVYPGPGDRGFTLVQSETPHLTPPADRDTVGVDVRGVPGRYSPERGQLEWIEAGAAHSLSSPTLSLDELLAIAARLEPR